MVHEGLTTAETAVHVGDEPPSQFSGELEWLFGRPRGTPQRPERR